jgi:hypothetical protein
MEVFPDAQFMCRFYPFFSMPERAWIRLMSGSFVGLATTLPLDAAKLAFIGLSELEADIRRGVLERRFFVVNTEVQVEGVPVILSISTSRGFAFLADRLFDPAYALNAPWPRGVNHPVNPVPVPAGSA